MNSFATYLAREESELKSKGLPLHRYQSLIAMRLAEFRSSIEKKLTESWMLEAIVRVYYSQNPSVIEILARFSKGEGILKEISSSLLTYNASDFSFVSIAENFEEPAGLRPEGATFLPLAMAIPSDSEVIGMDSCPSLSSQINERRNNYIQTLIGGPNGIALDFLRTSSQTAIQSGTSSSFSSRYDTSVGGGRTTPDYRTDSKQDDLYDNVLDTSDDPDRH